MFEIFLLSVLHPTFEELSPSTARFDNMHSITRTHTRRSTKLSRGDLPSGTSLLWSDSVGECIETIKRGLPSGTSFLWSDSVGARRRRTKALRRRAPKHNNTSCYLSIEASTQQKPRHVVELPSVGHWFSGLFSRKTHTHLLKQPQNHHPRTRSFYLCPNLRIQPIRILKEQKRF